MERIQQMTKKNTAKKILAGVFSFLLLFVFLLPVITNAALVTCGNNDAVDYETGKIGMGNPCDFTDFIELINNIIKWIISLAGVIFTIMAVWGGFLYMTSGEKPGNKDKAKKILWSTLTGFVIILMSWLIVYTLLKFLVPDDGEYENSIFRFIGNGK